ncbi:MAG: hypothetical protein OFPI_27320 [Osedax symbiont Rs2]|nr:MAG: hypothetical protein OFPI_27320 [Osedax symbiont Rs2]
MPQREVNNQVINSPSREVDLFEILEILWNSRLLILVITCITFGSGLLYNFKRVTPPPIYKISTQAHQNSDITTSIILTNNWYSANKVVSPFFSTIGMAKFNLGNNPYSPNSLYIRALEKMRSSKEKTIFFEEKNIYLDITIDFPKRISGIFEISVITEDKAKISNLKVQIVEYIKWSLARFDQSLITEANLLNSSFSENKLSTPLYISGEPIRLDETIKSKVILIITLSILLGFIIGSIISLVKNAIQTRYK